MVDRAGRDRLAASIRRLMAGQITNDEYEESLPLSSLDFAVSEIHDLGAWSLYSDLWQHRLVGRQRAPKEARREVARWLLFLKSDCEYEWPVWPAWLELLFLAANLASLGIFGWFWRRWYRPGPVEIWPFFQPSDLEKAVGSARSLSPVSVDRS
jgi:hypothetical protein